MTTQTVLGYDFPETPSGYSLRRRTEDGRMYRHIITDQAVILSVAIEQDERRWLHLSTSFPNRLPRWDELVKVKEAFLGAEIKAVQVIPPRDRYVNIHPYVLHLFACLDEDPLPHFDRGMGTL